MPCGRPGLQEAQWGCEESLDCGFCGNRKGRARRAPIGWFEPSPWALERREDEARRERL